MFDHKGFTLIETIVTVAILTLLALIGVGTITQFQKNAVLDAVANEFASSLRDARTKSIAGEFGEALEDKTPEDFAPQGLPKYGVVLDNTTYALIQEYQLNTDPNPSLINLEIFPINNSLTILPVGKVSFARISGLTTANTFIVQRKDGGGQRIIEVNEKGISLIK